MQLLKIKRPRFFIALSVAVIVLLTGCREKTEAEQLAQLRESFTYTRYRQLSASGIPGAYKLYARGLELAGRPTAPPLDDSTLCSLHVLLAYSALSAERNMIAIAESDIVENMPGCEQFDRSASAALRAIAFHRQKWPNLAEQENLRVWTAEDPALQSELDLKVLLAHLALAYNALMDERWDRVMVHVDGIALTLRAPWLADLVRAGVAFHDGRAREALLSIKRLSEEPRVPAGVRCVLGEGIAKVEEHTGDIDSRLWTARLITRVLWITLRERGPEEVRRALEFVEQYTPGGHSEMDADAGMFTRIRRWWNHWNPWHEDDAPEEATPGHDAAPPPAGQLSCRDTPRA